MGKIKDDISKFDGDLVLKDIHSQDGRYIRTRDSITVVPESYDNFEISYNTSNLPEIVTYYRGTKSQVVNVTCVNDVNGSLNNRYFVVYSGRDNRGFYVWFNVGGSGVDPQLSGMIGVEVPIQQNETAQVVAKAVQITLSMSQFRDFFQATADTGGNTVKITATKMGLARSPEVGTSGLVITSDAGQRDVIRKVLIEYTNGNPVWEGQQLIGYNFNVFTGSFENSQTNFDEQIIKYWDFFATKLSCIEYTKVVQQQNSEYFFLFLLNASDEILNGYKVSKTRTNGDVSAELIELSDIDQSLLLLNNGSRLLLNNDSFVVLNQSGGGSLTTICEPSSGGGSCPSDNQAFGISGEVLSAVKAVYTDGNALFLANNNASIGQATVVGITRTAAGSIGANVRYQFAGDFEDSSLNFPVNDLIYLDTNGNLTNVAPDTTSEYLTVVGTSQGNGIIRIRIRPPVLL